MTYRMARVVRSTDKIHTMMETLSKGESKDGAFTTGMPNNTIQDSSLRT